MTDREIYDPADGVIDTASGIPLTEEALERLEREFLELEPEELRPSARRPGRHSSATCQPDLAAPAPLDGI